jgi:hypothetical protein
MNLAFANHPPNMRLRFVPQKIHLSKQAQNISVNHNSNNKKNPDPFGHLFPPHFFSSSFTFFSFFLLRRVTLFLRLQFAVTRDGRTLVVSPRTANSPIRETELAIARYNDSIEQIGWATLQIQTNPTLSDIEQVQAAGFLVCFLHFFFFYFGFFDLLCFAPLLPLPPLV